MAAVRPWREPEVSRRAPLFRKENLMLEELKEPISTLKEDIMNVWGRL